MSAGARAGEGTVCGACKTRCCEGPCSHEVTHDLPEPGEARCGQYRVIGDDLLGAFVFAIRLLYLHSLITDSERNKVSRRLRKWKP
jgi:hypothetical protein